LEPFFSCVRHRTGAGSQLNSNIFAQCLQVKVLILKKSRLLDRPSPCSPRPFFLAKLAIKLNFLANPFDFFGYPNKLGR